MKNRHSGDKIPVRNFKRNGVIRMTTDFHSHILPGIDDGSTSLRMSVAMLRRLAGQGITRVVATPHFYAQQNAPEKFFARREKAEFSLRQAMAQIPGLPEVIVGAEVCYFPGMSGTDMLPALTIGSTPYILVEMPHGPWTQGMYRELENIRNRHGLIPVIAHIDRYIKPLQQYGIPDRLYDMEMVVQANAGFFMNWRTRRLALQLLENDRIHLLGSDCHNMSDRPPNLDGAIDTIRRKLGDGALRRIADYESYILR